jgi:hypothetical protein
MLSAQARLVSMTSQMPRPANPRTGQYRQADLPKSVRMRHMATRGQPCRLPDTARAFIKTMGVGAAVTACGRAAAAKAQDYKPQDQKNLTQAAARYQDHPKENESCGSYPYFVFPKCCVPVEGERSARPAGALSVQRSPRSIAAGMPSRFKVMTASSGSIQTDPRSVSTLLGRT